MGLLAAPCHSARALRDSRMSSQSHEHRLHVLTEEEDTLGLAEHRMAAPQLILLRVSLNVHAWGPGESLLSSHDARSHVSPMVI